MLIRPPPNAESPQKKPIDHPSRIPRLSEKGKGGEKKQDAREFIMVVSMSSRLTNQNDLIVMNGCGVCPEEAPPPPKRARERSVWVDKGTTQAPPASGQALSTDEGRNQWPVSRRDNTRVLREVSKPDTFDNSIIDKTTAGAGIPRGY